MPADAPPPLQEVCTTADRGCFDIALMTDFSAYGWHWNLRGRAQVYVFNAAGQALGQFRTQFSRHGQMVVRHGVSVTAQRDGPVSIAGVLPVGAPNPWFIVSDEPCSARSVAEHHKGTQIEGGVLDLKRAAWHLDDTRLTQGGQFGHRLCVLGLATPVALREGTAVIATGQRRQVDPHWVRALSSVQIGGGTSGVA